MIILIFSFPHFTINPSVSFLLFYLYESTVFFSPFLCSFILSSSSFYPAVYPLFLSPPRIIAFCFFYSSILKSLSLEGFTSLVGYDQTATSSFPFHHSFLQFCCCPFTSCSAFCLCYYIQSLLFPPLVFVSFSLKEKNTKNGTEV